MRVGNSKVSTVEKLGDRCETFSGGGRQDCRVPLNQSKMSAGIAAAGLLGEFHEGAAEIFPDFPCRARKLHARVRSRQPSGN